MAGHGNRQCADSRADSKYVRDREGQGRHRPLLQRNRGGPTRVGLPGWRRRRRRPLPTLRSDRLGGECPGEVLPRHRHSSGAWLVIWTVAGSVHHPAARNTAAAIRRPPGAHGLLSAADKRATSLGHRRGARPNALASPVAALPGGYVLHHHVGICACNVPDSDPRLLCSGDPNFWCRAYGRRTWCNEYNASERPRAHARDRLAKGGWRAQARWAIGLCLFGGMVGTTAGMFIARLIALLTPLPASSRPLVTLIGFAVSSLVGLIAGIYPAHRAARLSPIEALRYE